MEGWETKAKAKRQVVKLRANIEPMRRLTGGGGGGAAKAWIGDEDEGWAIELTGC